jgi:guanylate cyclase, other
LKKIFFENSGTTEGAVEKRNFDLTDLPPPLFCRPRKSHKFISDSKQPSISCITNFGASDNKSILCESRRQSNAAAQRWNEIDGSHSLHGSMTGQNLPNSSPFTRQHRRLDHMALYINRHASESINDLRKYERNGNEECKKLVALVDPCPRNVLNSINSSSEEIGTS